MKQYKTLVIFFFILSIKFLFAQNFLLKKEIVGYSTGKMPIELYKAGSGNNVIIIISAINGNDISSKTASLNLIELISQKKIRIPADKSVWIIPELNPDGISKSKKTNEAGVDLNRNFNTDNWKKRFFYINNSYPAGEEPFSEPETKAIKTFFESFPKNINPVILTVFSKNNMIIPGSLSAANIKLSEIALENSECKLSIPGYDISGSLTNWLSDKLGFPSINILLKNKAENQNTELEKILISLLNSNFKEDILKHDIKNNTNKKYTKDDALVYFQHALPDKVIKKINNDENANEFIKLYQNIAYDEELLILVNKKFNISENYTPADLTALNGEFPTTKKNLMLRKIILTDLTNMFNASLQNKIDLVIISGYRSYEEQKNTFAYWEKILGSEEAKRVSAAPGSSQHQLGTAIDFNSLEFSFTSTKEGLWLKENAYKYGFTLSFPEGLEELTGFKFEPWHYRYIGKPASLMVYKYFDNVLETFLNWYWETKYNF